LGPLIWLDIHNKNIKEQKESLDKFTYQLHREINKKLNTKNDYDEIVKNMILTIKKILHNI
jgi:hypothetical protein